MPQAGANPVVINRLRELAVTDERKKREGSEIDIVTSASRFEPIGRDDGRRSLSELPPHVARQLSSRRIETALSTHVLAVLGRFGRRQLDQFRRRQPLAHDRAVPAHRPRKLSLRKSTSSAGGERRRYCCDEATHLPVVFLLAVGVDVIAAVHPPDVAVEARADVIQLVEDGDQLLARTNDRETAAR